MHDVYLVAGGTDLVKLLLVDYAVFCTGAEEYSQVKILKAVAYGVGHAHERRDAGSTRESDDLLRVAQAFIVKMPLRAGDRDMLPNDPVILNVRADKARIVALDSDVVFAALCPCRGRAE